MPRRCRIVADVSGEEFSWHTPIKPQRTGTPATTLTGRCLAPGRAALDLGGYTWKFVPTSSRERHPQADRLATTASRCTCAASPRARGCAGCAAGRGRPPGGVAGPVALLPRVLRRARRTSSRRGRAALPGARRTIPRNGPHRREAHARPRHDLDPPDRVRCGGALHPAAGVIALHLQGLAAIMESHFRFEERELEPLLDRLQLEADPGSVFGPL